MAASVSDNDNGLLSFLFHDPVEDPSIFFNHGDALNASLDRNMDGYELTEADFVDRANVDHDAVFAFFNSLKEKALKDPIDVKAKYTARPIVVYDHEVESCDESKNEEVYCVRLDDVFYEPCVKTQCIELLKQANCHESCFFRCCTNDPWRFYAKLTDKQAEDMRRIRGMWDVSRYYELEFWCLGWL